MEAQTLGKTFVIRKGDLAASFLPSGDVIELVHGTTRINQLSGNSLDGSLNNLYLRIHNEQGIRAFALLGIRSNAAVSFSKSQVKWVGEAAGIDYEVLFTLTESAWFWEVSLTGTAEQVDLIYGQDLGLAHRDAALSSEAYVCQYIDHAAFHSDKHGFVVCSRQNQPQEAGSFPYIQQGCLNGAVGYSTDGFQFYGQSYKETDQPEALTRPALANEVYQYEFAYTALQTGRTRLQGSQHFVFYAWFQPDHPSAITGIEFEKQLEEARSRAANISNESIQTESFESVFNPKLRTSIGEPLRALPLSMKELDECFPERILEEHQDGQLLSFFTPSYEHVVLKEKETRVERPHGHILLSGNGLTIHQPALSSTSYMYGVFNSQIVIGNTSMHKMISNTRNALNVMKASGQRIYIKIDGAYRLLTLPSVYEMGFNYSRWQYKTNDDCLTISVFAHADSPGITLTAESASHRTYDFLVTHQMVMNKDEYMAPFHMKQSGGKLTFTPDASAISADVYPNLAYDLSVIGTDYQVTDETALVEHVQPGSACLVVLDIRQAERFALVIHGRLDGEEVGSIERDEATEAEKCRAFYRDTMNGFRLTQHGRETEELARMNAAMWWYTHNMRIHYLSPHGLEQYAGAAWGTRDVCQGPVEYFMATGRYEIVREILLTVFSHQYEDDGSWPQWFMFDRYSSIRSGESHGDIIVWMLKALSDYLAATHDFDILDTPVPYTDRQTSLKTDHADSVRGHVQKEIAYIKRHFLPGTHLSSYGDGDWDDTLQPHNPSLKKHMASSWTVALTYQALNRFAETLAIRGAAEAEPLIALAKAIRSDYEQYLLGSDVIPGFLYLEQRDHPEFVIHPSDTKTGIQYRLLPMTRSMIAELFDPEQAERHYQLIKQELQHPDGVRLMNRPAVYRGGVSTNFKRAEQAANFGREVGLQYVHAHIRFVEAMAKLGKREETWKGLSVVNPILLSKSVPNAELRQSNTYFSSSDGKFNTRYEAQERFHELKQGHVPVKGGWRLYSSGPGIYVNQLIAKVLGIRMQGGDLVLDPVLPAQLDGLEVEFRYRGKPIQVRYSFVGADFETFKPRVNGQSLDGEAVANRYRKGGIRISRQQLEQIEQDGGWKIEVDIH
ncbi:cellobiose phosphorylase [Saccharibacillus sp. O16]|nr:cellobiose phosphorylase [Saccharibacillus sp. O16]